MKTERPEPISGKKRRAEQAEHRLSAVILGDFLAMRFDDVTARLGIHSGVAQTPTWNRRKFQKRIPAQLTVVFGVTGW